MIEIYTDGSCAKNGYEGSNGSYGFVVIQDEKVIDAFSSPRVENTSNNREEMKAIIHVLYKYGTNKEIVTVYTDSSYALNAFTNWMYSWYNKGWRKSSGETLKNLDLVKEYFSYDEQGYRINLVKVRGHVGNKWNEIADKLATKLITPEEVLSY